MKIQKCKQKRKREWSEATKTRIAAALGMSALVSLTACTKSSVSGNAVETSPAPSIANKTVEVAPGNTTSGESQSIATAVETSAKTGTTASPLSSSSELSSSSMEDPGPTAGIPYYDYEQEKQLQQQEQQQ
ncbi:MAG: hypothetical protein II565_03555 [Fibrobacter sp.]|nr:hypothetical protein [Fibrobacter sp.]MBQ5463995.1 hypothetical protein [Fibrobacter sp.]